MNRDKRESEYPIEQETQFILRFPEEPAKMLRQVLQSGDNLKNRLTIQIDNDMRHGQVRFDHWLMHGKIVDLPTIIESLKTIDNKSFYKTADICQMMICKYEPDQPTEEETPIKNKKKDPYKVDKKFLYPHGITPPTKNIRKRRFRKTLKKKCVEAPEIEKELRRLLRIDNEAVSVSWEVINEEEKSKSGPTTSTVNIKSEKKTKLERTLKHESISTNMTNPESTNVVDIFGGAVSDSDLEDDHVNVEMEDSRLSTYDSRLSDTNSMYTTNGMSEMKNLPIEFNSKMFQSFQGVQTPKISASHSRAATPGMAVLSKSGRLSSEDDGEYHSCDTSKDNMAFRIEKLRAELEELKQRRQRTQHEITGMENLALRNRFQDILHTFNQDIMYKEMEYQGLLTLQNSDDI